jgi:hypothetical protein
MTTKQNETKDRRSVLIAGAQGVSGNAVLKHYAALSGTTVYGLSRRPSESGGNVQHISVDLLNAEDIRTKLGQLKEITHLFFGAYIERPTAAEKKEVNVRLLRNLIDVLEENSPALRHITYERGYTSLAAHVAANSEDVWYGGGGPGSVLARNVYGGQGARMGGNRQKRESATNPLRTDGLLGLRRLHLSARLRQCL